MVKTRFQLNTGQNPPVFRYMIQVYRQEGFLRFYRGIEAEIVGMVPKSSAMYASYELFRRELVRLVPDDAMSPSSKLITTSFLAGGLSGIPEAITVTPPQIIKVRLQAKEFIGKYRGPYDCLRKLIQEEGISRLMTGLGATILRNSVWNSVYFGTMQYIGVTFGNRYRSKTSELANRLVTLTEGFVGAVFATCFNAPFDVVKSRFQSQVYDSSAAASGTLKYRNTIQTLRLIIAEEGIAACYRGFQPKAIRMGLGGGVAMMVFEALCKVFTIVIKES